jgi:hypothetical protein
VGVLESKDGSLRETDRQARKQGCKMPWFPDFASAVELARQQTRAAGLADPVGEGVRCAHERL